MGHQRYKPGAVRALRGEDGASIHEISEGATQSLPSHVLPHGFGVRRVVVTGTAPVVVGIKGVGRHNEQKPVMEANGGIVGVAISRLVSS